MPSVSKSQQRLMGAVYAYKKGELKDASDTVKNIAKHISKKDAKDFASTKHKGLPKRVKKSKKESRIYNFDTFVNESYIVEKKEVENKVIDMSTEELEKENDMFVKLQNKGKLTPHEERRWKQISKKINEK